MREKMKFINYQRLEKEDEYIQLEYVRFIKNEDERVFVKDDDIRCV